MDCGLWRDAGSATCANCSMWKIAEERLERKRDGKMQRRSRVGTQSRKIAIKIRTTRHKKHGNGMQAAGHTPAVQQRTHLVVQLSETLHRFPRDLISSSFARKKGERKGRKVEKEKEDVPSAE